MTVATRFPEWRLLVAGIATALALLAAARSGSVPAERPTIVVTRDAIERLRAARLRESGPALPPPPDETLVSLLVDEEVLWREGRALLEGEGDPVVRRRVEALRKALSSGIAGEAEAADVDPVAAARGVARTDLVLRRYLVEAARLALAAQGSGRSPDDGEIDAWAWAQRSRFERPGRLRFEHVFLSRDRRGAALASDAAAMLERLVAAGPADTAGGDVPGGKRPDAGRLPSPGDPFPSGSTFAGSPAAVDRAFGAGFADRVAVLPRGAWAGPLATPFGLHLVRLAEASGPAPARPESVRSRAALGLRRLGQERRLRERLAELRARYEVRVESPPGARASTGDDVSRPTAGS